MKGSQFNLSANYAWKKLEKLGKSDKNYFIEDEVGRGEGWGEYEKSKLTNRLLYKPLCMDKIFSTSKNERTLIGFWFLDILCSFWILYLLVRKKTIFAIFAPQHIQPEILKFLNFDPTNSIDWIWAIFVSIEQTEWLEWSSRNQKRISLILQPLPQLTFLL